MQKNLYKKQEILNYELQKTQQAFVSDTASSKELIQKEITVNQEEQRLLEKRIRMMKEFLNEVPTSDPQYSMLLSQIQMDQIEMDELKTRETLLSQKISE